MPIPLDPFRANELVINAISKKENIIYRKKNTTKVIPIDKTKSIGIIKRIEDELAKRYPNVKIKKSKDGNITKLIPISSGSYGNIHITTLKSEKSPILYGGKAYEAYFNSSIVDGLTKMKEMRDILDIPFSEFSNNFKLYLMIYANAKKIEIGPIQSTNMIGGENRKTDEQITLVGGKKINVSLKQENFFWWSGADTLDPVHSIRPKNIIEKAINIGIVTVNQKGEDKEIIFPAHISGIRTLATLDEIKKYAFGGTSDKIDYIVINAGKPNLDYEGDGNMIISMRGVNVFTNGKTRELIELQNDVYMVIYKTTGRSSSMKPYTNVSVKFVNRKNAYEQDRYGRNNVDIKL